MSCLQTPFYKALVAETLATIDQPGALLIPNRFCSLRSGQNANHRQQMADLTAFKEMECQILTDPQHELQLVKWVLLNIQQHLSDQCIVHGSHN